MSATVVNQTSQDINVRITKNNESEGSDTFYTIAPGKSDSWKRKNWQVAYVVRGSGVEIKSYAAIPGKSLIIGD